VIELTHRILDGLAEDYRRGAMTPGSQEHEDFVVAAIEYLPALIALARTVVPGKLLFEVRVPQVLGVSQNARGHWQTKARKIRQDRDAVSLVLSQSKPPKLPVNVVLIRCAPRLVDDDNAVGCCKGTRDSVAEWLGIDDRDPRVRWRVEQRKVPRTAQGTVIRVEASHAHG
jgi:hypothetical protein